MPEDKIAVNLKNLFQSDMLGMVYGDTSGNVSDLNDTFLRMVGYTREDFMAGKVGLGDLTPPEYSQLGKTAMRQLEDYGSFQPYELQFIRKDNSRVDVLLEGIRIRDAGGPVMLLAVDITEKKRLEQTLKGESLFRLMAEYSTMFIWFLDSEQQLTYANKGALNYLGVTFEELSAKGWGSFVYPEDLIVASNVIEELLEKKRYYENEIRLRRHDGEYRWFLSSGGPLINSNGDLVGSVGSTIDIHDRKLAEEALKQYSQRLEHSNKELEHFATIASHDLQEPLRKIMLFGDHLRKVDRNNLSAEGLDDLDRMERSIDKMQRLINDLLDLSKVTRRGKPFEKMNLNVVLRDVVGQLSYIFPDCRERVKIDCVMEIEADPSQIHQLMTQLLENALKFHEPGKLSKVDVTVRPQAGQCKITVADTGIGMKAEYLDKIFDTFVRLHHPVEYPGTGIGLSLVSKIVDRHGGTIAVESALGKGSVFTVMLPVSQQK